MFFLAIWVDIVFETFFSLFVGYDWLSLLLLSSVFILWVTLCYSLLCALAVVDFQTLLINGFSTFCDLLHSFVCVCWSMPEALDYLSHITVFYVDTTCVCLHLESISLNHFIFWMLCLTAMCSILGVCGFHWSFILMFYAFSYLMWSYLCYPSLMNECSQSVHIMVMVDCLIDRYF